MRPNFRNPTLGGAVPGVLLALATLAWNAPDAFAEFTSVTVKVEGLGCPVCAHGLEKKLGRVAGVSGVSTDLKSAEVQLNLAEGASVSVRSLDEAVRRAGFTLKSVRVTAVGALKAVNDRLLLSVRHTPQEFRLFEPSAREKEVDSDEPSQALGQATRSALQKLLKQGAVVAVTGQIHEKPKDGAWLSVEKFEVLP